MEVILLKDHDKLGDQHEIVTVKNGYGRNYLIPKGLAIIANSTNRRKLSELKRLALAQEAKLEKEYEAVAEKLAGEILKISAKAGTSGKIFGSVTNIQLAQALQDQLGVEVDRHKISLTEEVKMLGNYTADINMSRKFQIKVNFEVIQD